MPERLQRSPFVTFKPPGTVNYLKGCQKYAHQETGSGSGIFVKSQPVTIVDAGTQYRLHQIVRQTHSTHRRKLIEPASGTGFMKEERSEEHTSELQSRPHL